MTSIPGRSRSTRKSVGRRASPSTTFTIRMSKSATSPEVTNHFSAWIRQPVAVRSAVAAIPPGSDPAPASVTA